MIEEYIESLEYMLKLLSQLSTDELISLEAVDDFTISCKTLIPIASSTINSIIPIQDKRYKFEYLINMEFNDNTKTNVHKLLDDKDSNTFYWYGNVYQLQLREYDESLFGDGYYNLTFNTVSELKEHIKIQIYSDILFRLKWVNDNKQALLTNFIIDEDKNILKDIKVISNNEYLIEALKEDINDDFAYKIPSSRKVPANINGIKVISFVPITNKSKFGNIYYYK